MYSLFRSLDAGSEGGSALPSVWRTFDDAGIRIYRGDVTMWAGPPGAGKSVAALQYAIQAKVPTLYISCDMGSYLTSVRATAIITNQEINHLKGEMASNEGRERYRQVIVDEVNHLYMAYESRPSPEQIKEIELAFEELWGIPPELLVIDNLMNLFSGSENEWTGLRDLSQVSHYFAHEMGAAVLLLHHVNLGGYDITRPGPLGAIKGQVTELPAVILTMAKGERVLRVAAVKNRHDESDPTGKKYVELVFDEPKGILSDPLPVPAGPQWIPSYVPDWYERAAKDD